MEVHDTVQGAMIKTITRKRNENRQNGQYGEWEFESLKPKEKLFTVVLLCNSNNWKPKGLLRRRDRVIHIR